jgi:signal transduction histidine kinase
MRLCGFDVGALGAKAGNLRGLGLDGMRERLSLIGGTLEVESALGAGTTIFARIDLDDRRPAA